MLQSTASRTSDALVENLNLEERKKADELWHQTVGSVRCIQILTRRLHALSQRHSHIVSLTGYGDAHVWKQCLLQCSELAGLQVIEIEEASLHTQEMNDTLEALGTLPDKISHDDMVQATVHGSKQQAAASEGCHIGLPVQGCFQATAMAIHSPGSCLALNLEPCHR
jgi:hypothetical protein